MEIRSDVSSCYSCARQIWGKRREEGTDGRMVRRRFLFQFRYSESLEVFIRLGHENLGAGVDPRRERESVIGAVRGRSRSATIVAASDSTSVRNVAGVLLASFHPPPAVTLPYSYAFESQIAATSVVRNLRAFSVWR